MRYIKKSILLIIILLSVSCDNSHDEGYSILYEELVEYKIQIEKNNSEYVNVFEKQYGNNVVKVEPYYKRMQKAETICNDFVSYIELNKGKPEVNYDTIQQKYNDVLKEFELLLTSDFDKLLVIDYKLRFEKPNAIKNDINLILIQIDILKIENDMIKILLSMIDSHTTYFITQKMLDNANFDLEVGDYYEAKIFYGIELNAHCSIVLKSVSLDNIPVTIKSKTSIDDFASFKLYPEKSGKYKWEGSLTYMQPSGEYVDVPINGAFEIK